LFHRGIGIGRWSGALSGASIGAHGGRRKEIPGGVGQASRLFPSPFQKPELREGREWSAGG
jgi:hypothetical protein